MIHIDTRRVHDYDSLLLQSLHVQSVDSDAVFRHEAQSRPELAMSSAGNALSRTMIPSARSLQFSQPFMPGSVYSNKRLARLAHHQACEAKKLEALGE